MEASQLSNLQKEALSYLAEHTVLTLATYGPQGLWAAALFYTNDLFDIYFLSAGHTRHALNLAIDPRVAGTVQENYSDWGSIKGIQLEGYIELLSGPAKDRAISLYALRHPLITTSSKPIKAALIGVNWYRLTPQRLYLIDNSKGFGHRDAIDLDMK